jgi:SAM-dependent MidA family methyltransferase
LPAAPDADFGVGDLTAHLTEMIRTGGPMTLETYMGQVLTHPTLGYYTTQEPFGEAGDFITAPEVSQMFGELIGVWCAQTWTQMGSPDRVCLTEAGPGRGTLMKDLLRAAAKAPGFTDAIDVHLIEISPRLRAIQRDALGDTPVTWHDTLDTIPTDAPLILVSNELLDALPIRQFERTVQGWCERLVDVSPSLGSGGHGAGGSDFRLVLTQTPAGLRNPGIRHLETIAGPGRWGIVDRLWLGHIWRTGYTPSRGPSQTPSRIRRPRHRRPMRPRGFRHAGPSGS